MRVPTPRYAARGESRRATDERRETDRLESVVSRHTCTARRPHTNIRVVRVFDRGADCRRGIGFTFRDGMMSLKWDSLGRADAVSAFDDH